MGTVGFRPPGRGPALKIRCSSKKLAKKSRSGAANLDAWPDGRVALFRFVKNIEGVLPSIMHLMGVFN